VPGAAPAPLPALVGPAGGDDFLKMKVRWDFPPDLFFSPRFY
jgi:hypothetical protein